MLQKNRRLRRSRQCRCTRVKDKILNEIQDLHTVLMHTIESLSMSLAATTHSDRSNHEKMPEKCYCTTPTLHAPDSFCKPASSYWLDTSMKVNVPKVVPWWSTPSDL